MKAQVTLKNKLHKSFFMNNVRASEECSDSVVECLTPDRGVAGVSLTGGTMLCP